MGVVCRKASFRTLKETYAHVRFDKHDEHDYAEVVEEVEYHHYCDEEVVEFLDEFRVDEENQSNRHVIEDILQNDYLYYFQHVGDVLVQEDPVLVSDGTDSLRFQVENSDTYAERNAITNHSEKYGQNQFGVNQEVIGLFAVDEVVGKRAFVFEVLEVESCFLS